MNKSKALIPRETRERLERGAIDDSDFYWDIADSTVEVMADFLTRRDGGEVPFVHFTRADVYNAISRCCCKSAARVSVIAQVGAIFQPDLRQMIEARYGRWEFGYYEAISKMPAAEWNDIFQFLKDYLSGEIINPPRRLGVSEFIFLYEKHILGKHVETVDPDEPVCGADEVYLSGYISPSLPFQDAIRISATLVRSLLPYASKEAVKQVIYHVQELRKVIPDAMRELGINVPVDKDGIIS